MKKKFTLIAVFILIVFAFTSPLLVLAKSQKGEKKAAKVTTSGKKYNIALSMSFIGNDWQGVSKNIMLATAKLNYKDKVNNVDVYVAGTDVNNQNRQLLQMIAKGYDAIICYPVSPTGLDNAISKACEQGIVFMTYDAEVSNPCAYTVTFDQYGVGQKTAEWMVKVMNHKGNLVVINGVPGNTVDKLRTQGAKDVFSRYPDIKIIAEFWGMWAIGPTEEGMAKVLAAYDKIDGVWSQDAGPGILKAFLDVDRPLCPMVSSQQNAFRLSMLDPELKAKGLRICSYSSPLWQCAAALDNVVKILDGDTSLPHKILVDFEMVTDENVKLCKTGTAEEMNAGCNVHPAEYVSPGFMNDWYNAKYTKGVDLQMALTGVVPGVE